MGIEAQVHDAIHLEIKGDYAGLLIGNLGQVVDSINFLIGIAQTPGHRTG
jgi:predicted RNA-binding protein Jag